MLELPQGPLAGTFGRIMRLPIISHHSPSPSNSQLRRAERLAVALRAEKRRLRRVERFDSVRCQHIGDAPALHLDDYSEIPLCGRQQDVIYMQQRVCLRAATNDWIATTAAVDSAYVDYFENQLQLGPVHWVVPDSVGEPSRLALSCIRSRDARRKLSHAIRADGLRYIHPHHASLDVWTLAAWLHEFTRMPIQVIGPPVEVCRYANDKIEFAELVQRLLGRPYVPQTVGAYSMAKLSEAVRGLARTHPCLGVKIPNGIGGRGNVFIDAKGLRERSLNEIYDYLVHRFQVAGIPITGRFLVDVWETDVLQSGSAQTWIPPLDQGPPVIEGLFEQFIDGERGRFEGSRRLEASPKKVQELVDQSYLLTCVFQQLGYVGRCSFDFLLVDESNEAARVEYIECNGRWGGTSAPMTLLNRLLGDSWEAQRSFETRRVRDSRFADMSFAQLSRQFGDELYDARTRTGHTVLFNPARAPMHSEIEIVRWKSSGNDHPKYCLAPSAEESLAGRKHTAEHSLPRKGRCHVAN